ncbi:MAG: alpha/beta hydrolase [Pseudomonadota bacterium]
MPRRITRHTHGAARRWITLVPALFAFVAFAAAADDFVSRQVSFENAGASLAGTIVSPADGDIAAAVVFVHGSGRQPRSISLAEAMAEQGIATLVYDKRGVGESGGEYEQEKGVGEDNLRLLAGDASAAINALKAEEDLADLPIGLIGISQAGWIVPIAAEQNPNVEFLLLWSGPVCKVSEEDIFSKHTRDLDGERLPTFEEAVAARETPYVWPKWLGEDIDPATSLKQLEIPGLWIFGGQDGSIPVQLSMTRLDQLNEARQTAFEYIYFSAEGHNNIGPTLATAGDWIRNLNNQP